MSQDAPPVATIERTDDASGSAFVAVAQARDAFTGEYRLLLTRRGSGGSATTRQAGRVVLEPGDVQRLTTVRLGPLTDADEWRATLELIQDGEVVASRTLSPDEDPPEGR